jgi:hypothetical protein
MSELADRLPGEVIFAAYANQIRDRALMRYVDATARDASEPLPDSGEMAWLTSTGELQVYDGSDWRTMVRTDGSLPFTGEQTFTGGVVFGVGENFPVYYSANEPRYRVNHTGAGNLQWQQEDAQGLPGTFHNMLRLMWDGYTPGEGAVEVSVPLVADSTVQVAGTLTLTTDTGNQAIALTKSGAQYIDHVNGEAGGLIIRKSGANALDLNAGGDLVWDDWVAGAEMVRVRRQSQYSGNLGSASNSLRNVLIGQTAPDDAWGKDGDLFVRFT